MTEEELIEIAARAEAMDPGLWAGNDDELAEGCKCGESDSAMWHIHIGSCREGFQIHPSHNLRRAIRKDIPALVAEVRRLKGPHIIFPSARKDGDGTDYTVVSLKADLVRLQDRNAALLATLELIAASPTTLQGDCPWCGKAAGHIEWCPAERAFQAIEADGGGK